MPQYPDRNFIPVQWGDDWPGIFIRGDAVMGLIGYLIKFGPQGPMGRAYAEQLQRCLVRDGKDPDGLVRIRVDDADAR